MNSLGQQTRGAPKLKQRNLRRKNKGDISIEIGSDSGGGSLRRPPTSEEISPRNNRNSSSTMKRLCRLLMMLTCISIMIYIIILLYQRVLINTKGKSGVIGLRANAATTMKDAKG